MDETVAVWVTADRAAPTRGAEVSGAGVRGTHGSFHDGLDLQYAKLIVLEWNRRLV